MKVLLAEDDAKLGKLIKYMLEKNDISVEWVTRGDEVYEYATYEDYDVLILDWMMPGGKRRGRLPPPSGKRLRKGGADVDGPRCGGGPGDGP